MDKRWLLTDVPKGFDEDSQLDCENLETQQTKKMWYRIKLLGGAPDWPVVDGLMEVYPLSSENHKGWS